MSSAPPRASGYFRTSYAQDFALVETRARRVSLAAFLLLAALFPLAATPFQLDLATQVLLASIGALSLMLLTGFAGQVSLGHAGLIAAGAFTVGVSAKEFGAPFWIALPGATLVGALIGIVFGLPSLRLRGLYLTVSTLALHFLVIYLGQEYETKRGFSTGLVVEPPSLAGFEVSSGRAWYFVMFGFAGLTLLACVNLLRSRTGRAFRALRDHETVAEAIGVPVARYKLLAFVISSAMTAMAGGLFAYYRGFVSAEAFSPFLAIQYVAMIIVGGMGSLLGALLGAAFVTLFPYAIEGAMKVLPNASRYAGVIFAVNYASFGLVMILFLIFEPTGLAGLWRRVQAYFLNWPYRFSQTSEKRR